MGVAPIWRDNTLGKICDACPSPKECCPGGLGCCTPVSSRANAPFHVPPTFIDFVVWNGGFFWCLFFLLLLFCMGGCGLWCRSKSIFGRRCCRQGRQEEEPSERDSAGSCCAPPHYSSCGTMHRAPPPYTEVTSKPDLYPLVIAYTGDKTGGGNYLMVQYFRNFIVQPPLGTISAGTTVDSISSSLLCNSGTDQESNVPPPYEEPEIRRPVPTSLSGLSVATASVENAEDSAQRGACSMDVAPDSPTAASAHYRPSNVRLTTFGRAKKHYPQEVILQQPQRYCDLHYHSTDILAERHDSVSSDDFSQPRGSLQDFVSSDGLSRSGHQFSTSSDVSSLLGVNTPDSPPRATSPTVELRDLLDKIHRLPRTRLSQYSETAEDISDRACLLAAPDRPIHKSNTVQFYREKPKKPVRSKTFYLPFIHQRSGASLSAPSTPIAPLVSPLVRSSRDLRNSKEESNPLLVDENIPADEIF